MVHKRGGRHDVYLGTDAAFKAVKSVDPDALGSTANTLGRRLKERGLLLNVESENRTKAKPPGHPGRYWKLSLDSLVDLEQADGDEIDEAFPTSGNTGNGTVLDSHS